MMSIEEVEVAAKRSHPMTPIRCPKTEEAGTLSHYSERGKRKRAVVTVGGCF
jgi:hypothetical protein